MRRSTGIVADDGAIVGGRHLRRTPDATGHDDCERVAEP
jgi:hypothetical protein